LQEFRSYRREMSARWVELDAIRKLRARTRGPVLNSVTPATPATPELLFHFFTASNIVEVRLLHL
jgi:hypothetical protein